MSRHTYAHRSVCESPVCDGVCTWKGLYPGELEWHGACHYPPASFSHALSPARPGRYMTAWEHLSGLEVDVRMKDSGHKPRLGSLQRIRLLQSRCGRGVGGDGESNSRLTELDLASLSGHGVHRRSAWRALAGHSRQAPGRREGPESSRPRRACPRAPAGTPSTCTGCPAR
jgi:hypothetical protein